MKLISRILKPLSAYILIVLMIGTRVICDLSEVTSWSNSANHEDSIAEGQDSVTQDDTREAHDMDCSDCGTHPGNKQNQKQCCTNWFAFVAEPNRNSELRASLIETTRTDTSPIISEFRAQELAFIAPFVLLMDSKYPLNLNYLPSHPLRV